MNCLGWNNTGGRGVGGGQEGCLGPPGAAGGAPAGGHRGPGGG